MKLETVVIPRIRKNPKAKSDKILYVFFLVLESSWNTIAPFCIGYYFAKTHYVMLLLLLMIFVFVGLKIDYINGDVDFKIITMR